jgi:predicted metalloprotease with PDZ domain
MALAVVQQGRAIKSADASPMEATEGLRALPGDARLEGKWALLIVVVMATGLLTGYLLTRSETAEKRGYLGIAFSPLSAEQAKSLDTDHGFVMTKIFPGSPAESAGIRPGDVLIQVDDDLVRNAKGFHSIRSAWKPDQQVTLHVLRQGDGGPQKIAIEVTLMSYDTFNRVVDQTP